MSNNDDYNEEMDHVKMLERASPKKKSAILKYTASVDNGTPIFFTEQLQKDFELTVEDFDDDCDIVEEDVSEDDIGLNDEDDEVNLSIESADDNEDEGGRSTTLSSVLARNSSKRCSGFNATQAIRDAYVEKCERMRIVPSTRFLRMCGQQKMELNGVSLGPRAMKAMATALQMVTEVQDLDLTGAYISKEGMQHLSTAMVENPCIHKLNLSRNSLGHASVSIIHEMITNNQSITSLDLASNNFGDQSAHELAKIIEESDLSALNLSDNQLGNVSANPIASALRTNTALSNLNLSWNLFRLRGAAVILEAVKIHNGLEEFDFSHNGLGQEVSEVLGGFLEGNDTLKILKLQSTRMTDQALNMFAQTIAHNETLEVLDVSHNAFSIAIATTLLQAAVACKESQLKHLDLRGILIDDKFEDMVRSIQQQLPDLCCIYDKVPSKRQKKDFIGILFTHLQDSGENLRKLIYEDEIRLRMDEFITRVKASNSPLTADDLDHMMSMLDSGNNGFLQTGFLFHMWEKFTKRK